MKYIKTYEQVSLDKQKKWFDDMTVKEYDIIIPPTKIEELEELVSQLVDGEETSEDDMTKQWIADAKSGKDIGTLGHEAIHQLQPNKMFNKLPDLDFLGDPEVKWDDFVEDVERKQYYYSRPGEIMSFAWSYFINKDESIKKEYKRIGGDVNKVFLSYVDKYSKKAKNWLEEFKKQIPDIT